MGGPNSVVVTPEWSLLSFSGNLPILNGYIAMDVAARFKKENCKYVSVSLEGLAS